MKKSRSCVQSVHSVHANARMVYAVRVATRTYRPNRSSARERCKMRPIQLAFAMFFFQTAVYSFVRMVQTKGASNIISNFHATPST